MTAKRHPGRKEAEEINVIIKEYEITRPEDRLS
jgi:hypothetical protein